MELESLFNKVAGLQASNENQISAFYMKWNTQIKWVKGIAKQHYFILVEIQWKRMS